MRSSQYLASLLNSLDGRGYKAYRELEERGPFSFPGFVLFFDHVQGDPFAPPSHLRVRLSQELAGFPAELFSSPIRRLALEDFLSRRFSAALENLSRRRGTGRSGFFRTIELSPAVLERTSCRVNPNWVELRFFAGLPAAGRRVLGREAREMLLEDIPQAVQAVRYASLDPRKVSWHVDTVEDGWAIQAQLEGLGLVAFLAEGSILPRESGISERPLKSALPLIPPPPLTVELETPHRGRVRGMGIPRGVTLIVGGGYHGKSTLLRSLALGVYLHIPGDGRELVLAHPATVFIRAEDGRAVEKTDISPFISNLPDGTDTRAFSTQNASGSTSQAANIVEALEVGAKVLLFDEDTSATNFLIRDRRMQALVQKDREPITPLVDQVQKFFRERGVSSILVMGGSGDYLDIADTVIAMDHYRPYEVTAKAREVVASFPNLRLSEASGSLSLSTSRIPLPESVRPRGKPRIKAERDWLVYGDEEIDLTRIHQIAEVGQVRAIGTLLRHMSERFLDGRRCLAGALDDLERLMDKEGLEAGVRSLGGDFSRPRRFELAAALNRLRTLRCRRDGD